MKLVTSRCEVLAKRHRGVCYSLSEQGWFLFAIPLALTYDKSPLRSKPLNERVWAVAVWVMDSHDDHLKIGLDPALRVRVMLLRSPDASTFRHNR
jgi:hypothetical protein